MNGLLLTNDLNATDRRRADADLVRSALEGNEDACATLFHAHRTKVYCICLRMTNNTAEAEDLTQDAFLQVFRKLGTFRGGRRTLDLAPPGGSKLGSDASPQEGAAAVSLEEPANQETGAPKREHGKADARLSVSVDRIALTRAIKELPVGYPKIFLMHTLITRSLACCGARWEPPSRSFTKQK
jgi:RNA polymerase sigma-70 factor, ECF subfamily